MKPEPTISTRRGRPCNAACSSRRIFAGAHGEHAVQRALLSALGHGLGSDSGGDQQPVVVNLVAVGQ